MRPHPRGRIESQKDVSGEKPTKEHHFRCEKQPDTYFGIPETGVRSRGDCVRNLHLFSLHEHGLGTLAPHALARLHRFILHREITFASGETVFVRTAIRDRSADKISVWRR